MSGADRGLSSFLESASFEPSSLQDEVEEEATEGDSELDLSVGTTKNEGVAQSRSVKGDVIPVSVHYLTGRVLKSAKIKSEPRLILSWKTTDRNSLTRLS